MEEEPMAAALQSSPSLPPDPSAGGGGGNAGGADGAAKTLALLPDLDGRGDPAYGSGTPLGQRRRTEVESRLPEGEGAEEAGGGAGG